MFCIKCGKEIPDSAQFCNHCGNKVVTVQTQPAQNVRPQVQPQQTVSRTQAYSSSAPSEPVKQAKPKKKRFFSRILVIIIAVIVYFVVRYGAENLPSLFSGISKQDLLSSVNSGALYENGYLTYGLTRINAPGYTLTEGEGDEGDYLIGGNRTKAISVDKSFEDNVSYSLSDKQGILDSFKFKFTYQNVEMIEFSKYKVEGFPVIEYIIRATVNGTEKYMGELIIFPSNTASYTLRYSMESLAVNGSSSISSVFDTLSISEDYKYEIQSEGIAWAPEKQITVR